MGIRGLFSFIISKQVYEIVDLVKVAKTGRIELVVQASGIYNYIRDIVVMSSKRSYDNELIFSRFTEYDIISQVYVDFHLLFKHSGIDLVWVFDGFELISSFENDNTNSRSLESDIRIEILRCEHMIKQLQSVNAEIIHLNPGQICDSMARLCLDRGSYAIFVNCHADYIMFRGCKVIFAQMLKVCHGDDHLNVPIVEHKLTGSIFTKPDSFLCPVVDIGLVMRELGVTSFDQMMAICMLKGNNYISDECRTLTYLLGITRYENQDPFIVWVSNYVKRNNITPSNLGRIPALRNYTREHPEFIENIRESELYYTMRGDSLHITSPVISDDELTVFITNGVYNGSIAYRCYSMHLGIYEDSKLEEELPPNCQSINDVMFAIRERIYPFLVDRNLPCVKEYRFTEERIVEVTFISSDVKTHQIIGIPDGLNIFEDTWSHLEPERLNYVERYGLEKASILYPLRYLYKITKDVNLSVSEDEFKALFVTVFYRFADNYSIKLNETIPRDAFLRMKIKPSDRCVIIGVWCEQTYLYATSYCGGALNLTEHFPISNGIMNGSELYAFFECMIESHSTANDALSEFRSTLDDVVADVMHTFGEYYSILTQN